MPAGNDTKGTWQWYRQNNTGGFDVIAGENGTTYTPKSSDINKKLKAVYSMQENDSFTGSKETETTAIKKALVSNPAITEFKQGTDTADSRPTLDFTVRDIENVWYRIQKRVDDPPKIPTEIERTDLVNAGWTECTALQIKGIDKDHKKVDLEANTDYILYIVKPETGETQVSSITVSYTHLDVYKRQVGILVKIASQRSASGMLVSAACRIVQYDTVGVEIVPRKARFDNI